MEEGVVGGLVSDALELVDSLFDYFAAKFRLERYRIESQTRKLIARIAVVLGASVVLLVGLVFLSVGVVNLIATALQSPSAGWLIVGGFYLLVSVIALIIAGRRKTESKARSEHEAARRDRS